MLSFPASAFHVNTVCKDGTAYMYAGGRMNSAAAAELGAAFDGIEEVNIVVDLKDVSYISSACLRILLQVYKRISERGGTFRAQNPSPEVAKTFEITGLSSMLIVH